MGNDYEKFNTVLNLGSDFRENLTSAFTNSYGDVSWKMQNFTNYTPRQVLTRFMVREELFRKVLHIQGSIVECGVFGGSGVTSWLHLSSILEPLNYQRKIIGFDTFEGFPQIAAEDKKGSSPTLVQGGLAINESIYGELQNVIGLHSENFLVKFKDKTRLVRGDASKTIPEYIEKYPETIISLLYLDFDLYEPTKVALEKFVPRMPKGSIIVFDELNERAFPGETTALLEFTKLNRLKIERFSYDTKVSYAVIDSDLG